MGKMQEDTSPTCMAGWMSLLQQDPSQLGRVGMLLHDPTRCRVREYVLELQKLHEGYDAKALPVYEMVEVGW